MLPATAPSGFWLSGIRYFALEVRPPAHRLASAHFFSEISRLRLARDRGSSPWVPGCPAASLAHSPAGGVEGWLEAGGWRLEEKFPARERSRTVLAN